ncbi:3D domain-containing protein [Thermoclostridium stercorarium]|nr:3D domain-containing protein [Thermoclostridium stercorarium]
MRQNGVMSYRENERKSIMGNPNAKQRLPRQGTLTISIVRFVKSHVSVFILLVIMGVSVLVGYGIYDRLKKELKIVDGDSEVIVSTMGDDIETALNQLGVLVESYDYVSAPLSTKLTNDVIQEVFIKRAVPVTITIDGKTTEVMTYYDTVGETIKNNGIVLGPLDRIEGLDLDDPIQMGMNIKIVRVREEVLTEPEKIPYAIEEIPNEKMNKGEKRVIQAGVEGTMEKYYKLTYEDGRIVSREFLSEKVIEEPVTEIVEYGTVPNFVTSRGELVRYKKVIEMRATAYTSSYEDTGKNPGDPDFGICYTGLKAREGIIAVDPNVIPLYTKVYVEVIGNEPDYGFAIAGDIGSAVKGNTIDVYLDTREAVRKWGVKKVRVYILNEQDDDRWKKTDYTK